jgi:hypothetical protein
MQTESDGEIDDIDEIHPPRIMSPMLTRRELYMSGAIAIVLGAGAGFPYLVPAYRAGDGSDVLGALFSGSTVIAYGAAATWGWQLMLETIIQKHHCVTVPTANANAKKIAASFSLAGCSGTVNFFIVSKYNASLIYPVLTAVSFAGVDASGYYKIISYFTNARDASVSREYLESTSEKILKKLIMIFPVGSLIVNSYLSYEAGFKIVDNKFAAMPFALLALSSFGLDIFSAYEMVELAFSKPVEDQPRFSREQYLGKLLFMVLSFTVVLFATSSDAFIASDNFGPNIAGDILAGLAIGSGVILGSYVLNDLSNKSILLFSRPRPVNQALIELESIGDVPESEELIHRSHPQSSS